MLDADYVAPTSVADAVKALGQAGGDAKLLAGGTDLLVQMRGGRLRPKLIIDLKRLSELAEIREDEAGFWIGAAAPGIALGRCESLRAAWPGVVEAANLIGSDQVQARASLGGNLANASPAADSVPALIAAGAVCVIEGPGGRRQAPVETVQTGPGRTSLASDEIIVGFALPRRPERSGDAYLRLIPRTEMDIAVVGAGVNLEFDPNGVCTFARVSLGAVAPTALLVEDAGAALVGTTLDEAALAAMDAAVEAACRPIEDKRGTVAYRTRVAKVLARRAAAIARDRAMNRSMNGTTS
ncbi:MAG: xanthine dehydrogenase family protein subunit M [Maricaulaceae bacterium]|jgi:carbon-monoxide dehydrogenase medium subunit